MISEVLRELTVLKDINEANSDQMLMWDQRLEVQRVQKEVLNHLKEDKELDSIQWNKNKCGNARQNRSRVAENCTFCGTEHPLI